VDDTAMRTSAIVQKMLPFLCDDLNTVGLMGVLFESLDVVQNDIQELAAVKRFLQDVVGLPLMPLAEKITEITPEIEQLLAEREQARLAKDWARADALRGQLQDLGYAVQDKKS
jgi:cysteinyl-tRNA synthetase